MQKHIKGINSDSLRPSIKPRVSHKSDSSDNKEYALNTNISERRNYTQVESIQDKQAPFAYVSNFQENNLYSSNKDLASSFSFSEEDEKYEQQKVLFSKLLLSTNGNCLNIIRDMNQIKRQELLNFVRIGDNEATIHKNRIISHHIAVWLESMGYLEFQTKKKTIMNLQFIYPDEPEIEAIATKLYESLFHGFIPEEMQLKLLIQVCKKGWEYFSFFIGRFIKILRKFRTLNDDEQFLKEVQKCIESNN